MCWDYYYIAFILGYDLLHEPLEKSCISECDLCFEYCLDLARKFKESDEYKDMKQSEYDALCDWVENNYKEICEGMKRDWK